MGQRTLWVGAVLLALPVPPAAAQAASFGLTGEVRPRFEWEENPFWTDAFTSLRTRLAVDAAVGTRLDIVVQLQDSRRFGEEASVADRHAEGLDMHQAYLEARRPGSTPLVLRVGRQEVGWGDERLVGRRPWSDVGQSFDAARLTVGDAGRWAVTTLVATLAERGQTAPGAGGGDATLLALHLAMPGLRAQILREANVVMRFQDVDRTTLAAALDLPLPAGIRWTVDAAYQAGSQMAPAPGPGAMDIGAFFLAAHVERRLDGRLRQVRAGMDWYSGDGDPGDSDHAAFSILYGSRHKFRGFLDRFSLPDADTGDRGLVDVLLGTELAVAGAGARVDGHAFFTAVHRNGEDRQIGWELDVRVPFKALPGLDVETGYSIFLNRAAARGLGLGDDGDLTHWAYLQATASF